MINLSHIIFKLKSLGSIDAFFIPDFCSTSDFSIAIRLSQVFSLQYVARSFCHSPTLHSPEIDNQGV
jgi:hypothetical protein